MNVQLVVRGMQQTVKNPVHIHSLVHATGATELTHSISDHDVQQ
jgi:hypothetical protein